MRALGGLWDALGFLYPWAIVLRACANSQWPRSLCVGPRGGAVLEKPAFTVHVGIPELDWLQEESAAETNIFAKENRIQAGIGDFHARKKHFKNPWQKTVSLHTAIDRA